MNSRLAAFTAFAFLAGIAACKRSAPTPAWRAALERPSDLVRAGNGSLLVVGDKGITALRDGAVAWTSKSTGRVTALSSGCALVTEGSEVRCLRGSDGGIAWSAALPARVEGGTPTVIYAAEQRDGKVLLLLSDERIGVLDPGACAKGEACVTASAERVAKGVDSWDRLRVMPSGVRMHEQDHSLRVHDAAGATAMTFVARDSAFDAIGTADGKVYAVFDQQIQRLDPARCGAGSVWVGRKRSGADADAQPGCVETVASFDDHTAVDSNLAVVGSDVLFTADRELRREGAKRWKSPIDAASAPAVRGDTVYATCWNEGDGLFVTDVDLCALSIDTGELRWRAKLALRSSGLLDSPRVVVDGDWVYAATGKEVASFRLSP